MRASFLPYCKPQLDEAEIESIATSFRNGWLTSGPNVKEFEREFAERSGVSHAVALNSCTAALHVALAALGVGPGDEVVTPSLTFVAGAQCTLELGATPVFADIDPQTLSVTRETIEAVITERTKAIISMPYAGRPLGIASLAQFARERGIALIEDAAHAAGMLDQGEWAGTRSDAAAYSFYATKNLTTAEGGMLVTNNAELADRARILGLHGMSKDAWKRYSAGGSWRYDVVAPGFKYNLADPLAALGREQLARLDGMQRRRHELAARFRTAISAMNGVSMQAVPERNGDVHSWCMFVVMIDEKKSAVGRDRAIELLTEQNIGTSVHYVPTHLFSGYRSLRRSPLPETERVWQQMISLPLFPAMTDEDADDVLNALEAVVSPRVFAAEQAV
ncbi:MAG: DegT/DnrJ/EryC1/StrS aminotransferase family protein [Candidatus Eremiobacteraeota bacterium]|nr:DegT/DnrJ/EryC1/StrS aminotransferase family protein [Candidatus Eremiobacteraeota bacterium]